MPCRQVATYNGKFGTGQPTGGGYATEADCLNACKEGACCQGTTCSVKPQCQCQGANQNFRGVGTVCTATTCTGCLACVGKEIPATVSLSITIDASTIPSQHAHLTAQIRAAVDGTWTLSKGTFQNGRQDYIYEQGNVVGPNSTKNGIALGVTFACANQGSTKRGDQVSFLQMENWRGGPSLGIRFVGDGNDLSGPPSVIANLCTATSYSSRYLCWMLTLGTLPSGENVIVSADCILTT